MTTKSGSISNDEVTRFVGAPKGHPQLSSIFLHEPTGNIFLLTAQVVIPGLVLTPGAPPTRKITELHRCFTLDTQAVDVACRRRVRVVFLRLSKLASGCAIFFCGFALRTLRSRKPSRLSTVAIVLGAGTCFSL